MLYDVGDVAPITVDFEDEDGELADPTTVTFTLTEPDDAVTTYTYPPSGNITKTATGKYRVEWPCAKVGTHTGNLVGTGAIRAAEPFQFVVRA